MTVRPADDNTLTTAADLLHSGNVVAFPTETVYGLGADATQENAVEKVFEIKGRPSHNPLIVHVGRPDWVAGLALPDGRFDSLTRAFWPGPLTLVLLRRPDCPVTPLVSAGLETIAVRQPAHPVATELLAKVKRPLAAPSANPSGHVSPTRADHVAASLGEKLDLILDGGACTTGLESTVLDLTSHSPQLLRPGAISSAAISDVLGIKILDSGAMDLDLALSSPGQLEKHYAPGLPVRLNADSAQEGEALISFGPAPAGTINLSPAGDLAEAAANLFAAFHDLDDASRFTGIAVSPIPRDGIGHAINDRLSRAAKGR